MKNPKIQFYLYLVLIIMGSSIHSSSMPKVGFIIWDKLLHVFEYMFFGILGFRAFRRKKDQTQFFKISLILFGILFGCLDEYWQSFIPGRTPSLYDIVADGIGVSIGVLISSIFYRHF